MAITFQPQASTLLRRALVLDAGVSGAAGLLQLAATAPLSRWLAIDPGWLRGGGAVLLAWMLFVGWVATRKPIAPALAWTVIGVNLAWVAGSVLLLVEGAITPNALGLTFVLAQAAVVAVFAELQFFGLRRQLKAA
ncbi:hypothetical protein [Lysobacter sp. Root690]|uniref:hypothetical protein n=1 Tax=Lysobacter sp. Root690 TaxID=1736588 RepID=UPI0006F41383|nr:hypothetical protein [Lysobacter sp. Root690]KRB07229.1 hypothetical protein ASD86_14875 [Lysobacter sp. Root690]